MDSSDLSVAPSQRWNIVYHATTKSTHWTHIVIASHCEKLSWLGIAFTELEVGRAFGLFVVGPPGQMMVH